MASTTKAKNSSKETKSSWCSTVKVWLIKNMQTYLVTYTYIIYTLLCVNIIWLFNGIFYQRSTPIRHTATHVLLERYSVLLLHRYNLLLCLYNLQQNSHLRPQTHKWMLDYHNRFKLRLISSANRVMFGNVSSSAATRYAGFVKLQCSLYQMHHHTSQGNCSACENSCKRTLQWVWRDVFKVTEKKQPDELIMIILKWTGKLKLRKFLTTNCVIMGNVGSSHFVAEPTPSAVLAKLNFDHSFV